MTSLENSMTSSHSLNVTECVPVASSEYVAEIVGRQGSKIKALRAKTNTYIKTPVRGQEPVFVVTGRREDVATARREILCAAEHFSQIRASRIGGGGDQQDGGPREGFICSQGGSGIKSAAPVPGDVGCVDTADQITTQVRVPYRVVGLVVGPKGATVKRIQQDSQTYIVTPSRDREPVFTVTGRADNVERARQEIESYIALRCGMNPTGEFGANTLNFDLNTTNAILTNDGGRSMSSTAGNADNIPERFDDNVGSRCSVKNCENNGCDEGDKKKVFNGTLRGLNEANIAAFFHNLDSTTSCSNGVNLNLTSGAGHANNKKVMTPQKCGPLFRDAGDIAFSPAGKILSGDVSGRLQATANVHQLRINGINNISSSNYNNSNNNKNNVFMSPPSPFRNVNNNNDYNYFQLPSPSPTRQASFWTNADNVPSPLPLARGGLNGGFLSPFMDNLVSRDVALNDVVSYDVTRRGCHDVAMTIRPESHGGNGFPIAGRWAGGELADDGALQCAPTRPGSGGSLTRSSSTSPTDSTPYGPWQPPAGPLTVDYGGGRDGLVPSSFHGGPKRCVTCSDSDVMAALVPCGHSSFCMDCAAAILSQPSITDRRCPICLQPAALSVRILQ